jgi:hypothetical protein
VLEQTVSPVTCVTDRLSTRPLLTSIHMAPNVNTPPKRGPGRPKGSNNKLNASTEAILVGRPRKHHLVDDATPKNTSTGPTGPVGKYYLLFVNWPNQREYFRQCP